MKRACANPSPRGALRGADPERMIDLSGLQPEGSIQDVKA